MIGAIDQLPPPAVDVGSLGSLQIVLGGIVKWIRPLSVNATEVWQQLATVTLQTMLAGFVLSGDDWGKILGSLGSLTRLEIDLLVAYDRDGRLGGAEWIGDHATPLEIWDAFKIVIAAVYPSATDAGQFFGGLVGASPGFPSGADPGEDE